MQGLVLLGEAVGKEKRPLSWAIGEQGVIRPHSPSMREVRAEARKAMVDFRGVDEV